jgi:Zn-dependent protease with chaperone function
MALTNEEFAALVKQLEGLAEKQPGVYRWRVGMLAMLGYVYLAAIVLGFIGAVIVSTMLIVAIGVPDGRLFLIPFLFLIPVFVVLRSLWVKFPAPEGTRIKRRQAPELFALLDELRQQLKAPRFHRVLIDRDFNAAVSQIPRLGMLGWQTNYLLVGLPLMQSLSPEQFRAVLAHEIGHLSGNHSQFSGWIYRVRLTWARVLDNFEQDGNEWLLWTVNRFLKWYVPFFNAYSFVLARADEYEADRCAANLAGKQNCAEALVAMRVKAPQLHNFWDQVSDRIRQDATPPAAYSELMAALRQPVAKSMTQKALATAFEQATDLTDTHPCLRDRLTALAYRIHRPEDLPVPAPAGMTAADRFLGPGLVDILAQYDREWQSEVSSHWSERYSYLQRQQNRLNELNAKAIMPGLTQGERWEQAYRTMEVAGNAVALPLMQAFLANFPNHPAANYNVGMMLLSQGDATGVKLVRSAILRRYDWFADGCQLVYKFWYDQGEVEKAKEWQEYYQQESSKLALAEHERVRISSRDRLVSHGLDAAQLQSLQQQIAQYPGIERVYLARKEVKHFPDDRLFVVGLVLKSPSQEEAILDAFDVELGVPGRQRVLALNGRVMPRQDLELALQEQRAVVHPARS